MLYLSPQTKEWITEFNEWNRNETVSSVEREAQRERMKNWKRGSVENGGLWKKVMYFSKVLSFLKA